MKRLVLIRHGQASFGADDYDVLSKTGHAQAKALGAALARLGVVPDRLWRGDMRRHRETLEGICLGMGISPKAQVHPGLNEFDFSGLLTARYARGGAPDGLHTDHRTHFRNLRDTMQMWADDKIENPPESWADFTARVAAARDAMSGEGTVFAISSGGAISRMIGLSLGLETASIIELQLQMKNCAASTLVGGRHVLHSFNETPHLNGADDPLLTYA